MNRYILQNDNYQIICYPDNPVKGESMNDVYLPELALLDFPKIKESFDSDVPIGMQLAGTCEFSIDVNTLIDDGLTDFWALIRDNGVTFEKQFAPTELFVNEFLNPVVFWEIREKNTDGYYNKLIFQGCQNPSDATEFTNSGDIAKFSIKLTSLYKWILDNIKPTLIINYGIALIQRPADVFHAKGNFLIFDELKKEGSKERYLFDRAKNNDYEYFIIRGSQFLDAINVGVGMLGEWITRYTVATTNLKLPTPFKYWKFFNQSLLFSVKRGSSIDNLDNLGVLCYTKIKDTYNYHGKLTNYSTAWDMLSRLYEAFLMRVSFYITGDLLNSDSSLFNTNTGLPLINSENIADGSDLVVQDLSYYYKKINVLFESIHQLDINSNSENSGGSLSSNEFSADLAFTNLPTHKEEFYRVMDRDYRYGATYFRKDRAYNFPYFKLISNENNGNFPQIIAVEPQNDGTQIQKVWHSAIYDNKIDLGDSVKNISDCNDEDSYQEYVTDVQNFSIGATSAKAIKEFLINKKVFYLTFDLDLTTFDGYFELNLGREYSLEFVNEIRDYTGNRPNKRAILVNYELDLSERTAKCKFMTRGDQWA